MDSIGLPKGTWERSTVLKILFLAHSKLFIKCKACYKFLQRTDTKGNKSVIS